MGIWNELLEDYDDAQDLLYRMAGFKKALSRP